MNKLFSWFKYLIQPFLNSKYQAQAIIEQIMAESGNKRRIVITDDDDANSGDEIDSNPDIDDGEINEEIPDEDDGDGEDLMENIYEDYVAVPELDMYDTADLAEEEVDNTSWSLKLEAKRAAEEDLDRRDMERAKNRAQRLREAANDVEDERELKRNRVAEEIVVEEGKEGEEEGEDIVLNIEAFDVPLREWISQERTRREIKRRFKDFLNTFSNVDPDEEAERALVESEGTEVVKPRRRKRDLIYVSRIREMCSANGSSLEVSFLHLGKGPAILAIWLADVPKEMLQIFDEVLVEEVSRLYQDYAKIVANLKVRITDLPIDDRLRDLRQSDLNNLVRVTGVITRRTSVYPQMQSSFYRCEACNHDAGPYPVINGQENYPMECPHCRMRGKCKILPARCEYGNYQKITLQEAPGSVPPGRVPRYKDVHLYGDLIDMARPGEEVDVTAIYAHNLTNATVLSRDRSGFPVFSTILEANCMHKKNGNGNTGLSDDDKRQIRELAADPQISERIFRSIAPSIFGHSHIKQAFALALFGGVAKEAGNNGTHRVRGDINILMVGDPGTAKSQMLKYAQTTAPRAVYTTGKGASAVGLTAGVHKDPITREWTLEGGALVLADQGVCLIDEFDKMKEQDRTSIHEAMEQQTISVSKAGIVCSLQARCAVFAAANPIGGRYDASYSIAENVELTDPILQRFDILCVVQDLVDPVVDTQMAKFVVSSHMRSHPEFNPHAGALDPTEDSAVSNTDEGVALAEVLGADADMSNGNMDDGGPQPIPQDLLKKYISYSRAMIRPVVHEMDVEKIAKLYAELREQSAASGGVPIAVRHLESMVRMAEASAKMHLRDYVRDDDVDLAIKITLQSFLQAQKVSVRKALQSKFKQYLVYREENNRLLLHQLLSLMNDAEKYQQAQSNTSSTEVQVFISDLQTRANGLNIFDLKPFFNSKLFKGYGMEVNERSGMIVKRFDK